MIRRIKENFKKVKKDVVPITLASVYTLAAAFVISYAIAGLSL